MLGGMINTELLAAPAQQPPAFPAHTRPAPPAAADPRFVVARRTYTQQYAGLYFVRLVQLRQRLLRACEARWTDYPFVPKILDVKKGRPAYVVGTIYMELPNKPNILDDVAFEYGFEKQPTASEKYVGAAEDQILLEDESGRVRLVGARLAKEKLLVTGVVVGVLGVENDSGDFEVLDFFYADPAPCPDRPAVAEDACVVLVSGLEIGGAQYSVRHQLLLDYLTCELGAGTEGSRVAHVILAGNNVQQPEQLNFTEHRLTKKTMHFDQTNLVLADNFMSELASCVSLDLMPGEREPSMSSYPQQRMQPCLFPKTAGFSSFRCVTNPCEIDIAGVKILGTSGQNVDDIWKYIPEQDESAGDDSLSRVDALEAMLSWNHVAPTSPDTLWSYPYKDEDPFVVDATPHVLFAGNQPRFETRTVSHSEDEKKKTLLVCVPSFVATGQVVVVNLRTLDCEVVEVGVSE